MLCHLAWRMRENFHEPETPAKSFAGAQARGVDNARAYLGVSALGGGGVGSTGLGMTGTGSGRRGPGASRTG